MWLEDSPRFHKVAGLHGSCCDSKSWQSHSDRELIMDIACFSMDIAIDGFHQSCQLGTKMSTLFNTIGLVYCSVDIQYIMPPPLEGTLPRGCSSLPDHWLPLSSSLILDVLSWSRREGFRDPGRLVALTWSLHPSAICCRPPPAPVWPIENTHVTLLSFTLFTHWL